MSIILFMLALLAAPHSVSSEVCTKKLQLGFLVDGSSTICGGTASCPNWESILQFCRDVADSLIVGPGQSKVAFIEFSADSVVEWDLNKHKDKPSLLSAIDKVAFKGGLLKKEAVDSSIVIDKAFHITSGNKLDSPNVLIVITDGAPNIEAEHIVAECNAVQKAGIKMFVVCVTERCTESFVQDVASPPKQANVTYFRVDNFFSIDDVRENLVKQICAS